MGLQKQEKYYPKTIGELKEVMEGLPDDYPIGYEDSDGHPIGGVWVEPKGKYFHESHTKKERFLFDIN